MLKLSLRIAIVLTLLTGVQGYAETDTICILHTNDIHDHVRSGYSGMGGMPYVSGYVKSVRAERDDTMLIDAGDVFHKGDMVAARSDSAINYEAMGKIGYDAIAPGNHDIDLGFPHLQQQCDAVGISVLCVNIKGEGDTPFFAPSKIIDVDGVKVGIIGLTATGRNDVLNAEQTAQAVAQESERLEPLVHLIVAVCHDGSKRCTEISQAAPLVDVFAVGHHHEALQEPKIVPETGALLIGAGSYANYVGQLELTIDLETEKILDHKGKLIPMKHDVIPCDTEMDQWIKAYEQKICPEATQIVGQTAKTLSPAELSKLYAEALRQSAKADLALFTSNYVLSGLVSGAVDRNALFAGTLAADHPIVVISVQGAALLAYAASDAAKARRMVWSGKALDADTDPDIAYTVAMTQGTWNGLVKKHLKAGSWKESPAVSTTVLDAAVALMESQK